LPAEKGKVSSSITALSGRKTLSTTLNTGTGGSGTQQQRALSNAHMLTGGASAAATNINMMAGQFNDASTAKQLLGELYEDKEYLQKFLGDKEFSGNPNEAVQKLISEGLSYLEARTEFWRQQKPMYARKKDIFHRKPTVTKLSEPAQGNASPEPTENQPALPFETDREADAWSNTKMGEIRKALDRGGNAKALQLAKSHMKALNHAKSTGKLTLLTNSV
jgi:hypothetical protein